MTPSRTAHSQESAGIGVEGHDANANGEVNRAAHSRVAAATAPGGKPTNWRRIRFAPNPYKREAPVPASAAGQTLMPPIFPLARTVTPTNPAMSPTVRRALMG